jgi:hypothetical protein
MSDEIPTLEPGATYESADGKQRATIERMHTCPDGSELARVVLPGGKMDWWLVPQMFIGWRRVARKTPWSEHGWKWVEPGETP